VLYIICIAHFSFIIYLFIIIHFSQSIIIMAYSKVSIQAAATGSAIFTDAEVAAFQAGTLKLASVKLINMRDQIEAQDNIAALELLEYLVANPAKRTRVPFAQDIIDAQSGDPVNPLDGIDFNNIPDDIMSAARNFATSEKSGLLVARQMLTVSSFSEPVAAGRSTKKNIVITGTFTGSTDIVTARINDARIATLQPLLKIGSIAECSVDSNGAYWVDSVITESDEVLAQREALAKKAKAEKVDEIELSNKSSKGAAILGLAQSGSITEATSIEALLKAIQSL
jgi:hypothetical protein